MPVRSSPLQKDTQKHWLSDSSQSRSQSRSRSQSQSLSHLLGSLDSLSFGSWSDTDSGSDTDTPYIPSLAYIFPTPDKIVTYTKEWALLVGYALVITRSTTKDNELT